MTALESNTRHSIEALLDGGVDPELTERRPRGLAATAMSTCEFGARSRTASFGSVGKSILFAELGQARNVSCTHGGE